MSKQVPDVQQEIPNGDEPSEEEDSFGRGSIEERLDAGEFQRSERIRNSLNNGIVYVALVAPYFLAIVGTALILVMLWHYLGPESRTWMTQQQIDKIEAAAGGGIVSAIFIMLRDYMTRRK